MAIRILTKNGIENTNIDGARDNNFNAGQRSGVVKGILNEGNIYANGSSLVLEPCELRICGHRIIIDENEIRTFTNKPQSATKQSLIAQIVVSETDNVEFELIVQGIGNDLIQDNLDKTGMGKYQLLLATFTQNTDGTISNVEKAFDVITGMTREQLQEVLNNSSTALSQANTALGTANTALTNSQNAITGSNNATATANTALTQSNTALETANNALDRVVEGLGTKVSVGGTTQSTINFASDPQTQINSTNSQVSANTGNISNLSTNKADKTLSNVTYPQVVADGLARIGVCDRIVERWVSSNGLTWYEKYQSGWKKCGGIYTIAEDGRDETLTLPISFSNTNYFCRATALYATLKDNYDRGAFGSHPISTNTISISSSRVANTGTYAFKCYWTAEGY